MADYLGWIGNVFILAGAWFVGGKWRPAFLFTFIGEMIWCVQSAALGRADMLAICAVFGVLALVNWWKWGRNE